MREIQLPKKILDEFEKYCKEKKISEQKKKELLEKLKKNL